jgi:hypothetical protein
MTTFQCPHCGLLTQVAPQYAGHSGPCAGCGRIITIPHTPAAPASSAAPTTRLPTWLKFALALSATLLGMLLLIGLLVQLIRPAVLQARQNARRAACHSQVERVLQALHAYRNAHGTLPPAYSVDDQGRPLHSWRVLLLPYLGPEAQAVHYQLRLNEPWDSPHNLPFSTRAPSVFVCPDDRAIAAGDTSYCAVVGDRCAFRSSTPVDAEQFSDDPRTLLLIVEAHGSGINWMQPLDISPVDLAQGVNSGVRGSCGSHHTGGVATVGTADGRAHSLSDATHPDDLLEMATVDGGESPRPLFAP